MTIIGIDPGSRFCGYGLLVFEKRKIIQAGCDVIKLDNNLELSEKLVVIHDRLEDIVNKYKPDVASIESIFYDKNIRSSIVLAHARGVIMYLLQSMGIAIYEYSPREIKKSVVGNGNASKEQVKYMIENTLSLKHLPKGFDATDGLATAMCHYNRIRFEL